jgi:L-alanine-DL-glutamate epimerase-like enolase superfamily enzyme
VSPATPAVRILDVCELAAPLASPMRNAFIDFSQMTCSVVAIHAERGGRRFTGYGYTSNGRYAQSGLLRERFIPRLLAADPADLSDESGGNVDPRRLRRVVMRNEKPGGHGERSVAVGALDMALWDLGAKIADVPAAQFIAATYGLPAPRGRVRAYAAGGYYDPAGGLPDLRREIRRFVDLGYPLVKMKIGGMPLAADMERVATAVDEAQPAARVAVDANGGLGTDDAVAYGRALAPLGVAWFEEPVDPLDFGGLAEVARAVDVPLATGENLFSLSDVRNLLRFGGLDRGTATLQMDPTLSYGLAEYAEMLATGDAASWSRERWIPHGGHHLNVAAAAAFHLPAIEVYPTRFQPFSVVNHTTVAVEGSLPVPEVAGLGMELRPELAAMLPQLE